MITHVYVELIVIVLCVALSTCTAERTLEMVHVFYRHGNRAPMSNYPTDSRSPSTWPLRLGQLTNIGRLQHYYLGEWLRNRYGDILINTTYNSNEIYARSTDIDRTLMSAQCNMAGLYPPKGKEVWFPEDVLTWQPIPIHTTMVTMDCLIGFPPCPKYLALLDEAKKSEVVRQYEKTNKDFLDFMREKSGLEHSTSMFDLVAVADSSYFEKVGNKPLPEWFNSSIFDKLMDLNNFATKVKEGSDNMEMKRFCKGVLLNEIADNMIAKARSPQNRTYKMYSYAGQDSMISCILNALGVFNNIVPPPASCVMIELHKHVHAKRERHHRHQRNMEIPVFDGTYTVDIYYRNDSSVDPIVLTIPECQTHCPLETFLELTSDVRVTEERWFKDCGGERNFQSYSRGANLHLNKGDHLEY